MGTITVTPYGADPVTVNSANLNALVSPIVTECNGSLDTTNIAADAGILGTQLEAKLDDTGLLSGKAFTELASTPSGAGILPRANLPLAVLDTVTALADGAGSVIDASLGNIFTMEATGNRTLGTTTNGTDGQKIVIRHTASGGARTLTLPVATDGDFAFGSDVTAITVTASGKVDYIGCIYEGGSVKRWHVVAYSKGY
jgi:hypothetical protein